MQTNNRLASGSHQDASGTRPRSIIPVDDGSRELLDTQQTLDEVRTLVSESQQETALLIQQAMQSGMEEIKIVAKLLEDCGGEMTYERTITIIEE